MLAATLHPHRSPAPAARSVRSIMATAAFVLYGLLVCARTAEPAQATPATTPPPTTTEDAAPMREERRFNLPALIAKGLAAGDKEIVIPPGRYRVSPADQQHLLLRGVKDTTIVADGVEMVCTETTRAITIEGCENLTIRGLTIDYDPLPYSQGVITAISEDAGWLKVDILEGYPEPRQSTGSVEIFNPATDTLRGRVTYYNTRCEPSGPGRVVLTKSRTGPGFAIAQLGDIAVIKAADAPGGSIPHVIFATGSKGLVFDKVTLHSGPMFGFLENGCDGSRYLQCRVDRRDAADDFHPRAHRRLRSINADAFHSKNARQGPDYDGCKAFFMGDDAIAINGDYHYIIQAEGPRLRVLAKREMTLKEGDEVQLFTKDGQRRDNLRVVSVVDDGPTTAEERAMLLEQELNDTLRREALASGYLVTLDQEPDVKPGTLICNTRAIGNGFAIRNCHLGYNRSRGILVKAGYGEITNNHVEGATMTSILVAPEYWWLEAGLADNLVIADNRITGGGGMGIAVFAVSGDRKLVPGGAFRNITVRGNTIEGGPSPGILLASIRGLTEEDNTVTPNPDKFLASWETEVFGRSDFQPVMKFNIEPEPSAP